MLLDLKCKIPDWWTKINVFAYLCVFVRMTG